LLGGLLIFGSVPHYVATPHSPSTNPPCPFLLQVFSGNRELSAFRRERWHVFGWRLSNFLHSRLPLCSMEEMGTYLPGLLFFRLTRNLGFCPTRIAGSSLSYLIKIELSTTFSPPKTCDFPSFCLNVCSVQTPPN